MGQVLASLRHVAIRLSPVETKESAGQLGAKSAITIRLS